MKKSKLDFYKTIETNRLEFEGKQFDKIGSLLVMSPIVLIGGYISYDVFNAQIKNNPKFMDYVIAFFIPILILLIIIYFFNAKLDRDKLMKMETKINKSSAKIKLLEAAKALNWLLEEDNENYMIFKTDYGLMKNVQIVSIVLFQDDKFYFNSMSFPNRYLGKARFEENFQALVDEYKRIEND